MPSIVTTTVFTIDELSDAAREKARSWYRESCLDYEWYDFVYEDFETICGILGVTLRTSPVGLYGGGTRDKPHLYWTGFWNQGDGASFEGTYAHAKGAAKGDPRPCAPRMTNCIASRTPCRAVQKPNFWQLHTTISQRGRYYHEHTMTIEIERDSPTWQPPTDDAEDTVTEGHARSRTLALPSAPGRVRAFNLGRSDRRDPRRQCLDVHEKRQAFRLTAPPPLKGTSTMTGTPRRQMVLRMTVDHTDAKPFTTIRDADDFAGPRALRLPLRHRHHRWPHRPLQTERRPTSSRSASKPPPPSTGPRAALTALPFQPPNRTPEATDADLDQLHLRRTPAHPRKAP